MPIVEIPASQPPAPLPSSVVVETKEYKGVAVDNRYTPATSLLTHLEGSSWTVNYYSQVLDQSNTPQGQQVGQPGPYQQYKLIKTLELKVANDLSSTQDVENKEFNTTGTATLYPSVIPVEGDMFLAKIGDGRLGVFEVTSSERLSIFKDAAHTIEYKLVDYATAERVSDLNAKVVETYNFLKDQLYYGQNPVVQKNEAQVIRELQQHYREIAKDYCKHFFSRERQSLIIPGQPFLIYDPFLTKAVKRILDTTQANELRYIREFNITDDQNLSGNSIWDCMIENDYDKLNNIFERYGLVSVKQFTAQPMMMSLRYSGVHQTVYPKDPDIPVDLYSPHVEKVLLDSLLVNVAPRAGLPPPTPYPIDGSGCDFNADLLMLYRAARDGTEVDPNYPLPPINPEDYLDLVENIEDFSTLDCVPPDIHLVTIDDFYVFSEAFYLFNDGLQGPMLSQLEVSVCRMLRNESIRRDRLLHICQSYHRWGALERFYYLPVLLMLIKYTVSSVN